MNLLEDVITYLRRIVKTPSNAVLSDNIIIDYINRFVTNDIDARIQLFDYKTKYQFMTSPGVDQYNMPLYDIQTEPGAQTIGMYPVYQGFLGPAYINGIPVGFETQKQNFFGGWINVVQQMSIVATGNGTTGPYTFQFPISPVNNPAVPLNPPIQAILRGHVDISGIISTGVNQDPPLGTTLNTAIPSTSIYPAVYLTSNDNNGTNIIVQDSGQFLSTYPNLGLLMAPGTAPFGYSALSGGYVNSFAITAITQATQAVITATTNFSIGQTVEITGVIGMTELNGNTYTITNVTPTTITINVDSTAFTAYISGGFVESFSNIINYLTGTVTNVFFPAVIPSGVNISAQCHYFQTGLPRGILFYNNVLTLRSPPDRQYLVELDAYLSPAAYLLTADTIKFGYMSEYIARGAARKLLSDTGDVEQFMFYEPLFREQEMLVWKRSQRQWTATRTETIYSRGPNMGQSGFNSQGGTTF